MLPLELSTEICSLKPDVDRLVLSALLEIDHRGEIVRAGILPGRDPQRGTHDLHRRPAAAGRRRGLRQRYEPLMARFELMRELALVLNRSACSAAPSISICRSRCIEFDEFGEMTGVTRSPRNIAHRLIEEFMLAANEAVASHLEQAGIPSIFRIHEKPDPKRVMEFEEMAAHFGYSLGIGAMPVKRFGIPSAGATAGRCGRIVMPPTDMAISSRNYQKLIAKSRASRKNEF